MTPNSTSCLGDVNGARFDALWRRWKWRAIPNCPGRYVYAEGLSAHSPQKLAGSSAQPAIFEQSTARDTVHVMVLTDGAGLISYVKPGGLFLHTLNTAEGLQRKLSALAVVIPNGERDDRRRAN